MINPSGKSVVGAGQARTSSTPTPPPTADVTVATGTLVAIGYRPYRIVRKGIACEVWAKDQAAVEWYSPGEVTLITMPKGMTMSPNAVILLDPEDRGRAGGSKEQTHGDVCPGD